MPTPREILVEGAAALGVRLTESQVALLEQHVALLLKWNKSINLTAVTAPAQVAELHVVDSLALAPLLQPGLVLDAGAGGGFPGIPLRIVRDDLDVWMVDSVGKKVAFLKAAQAALGLKGLQSKAVRLEGRPEKEGLSLVRTCVSRAFAAPADWLKLAEPYLLPGGTVFCLLGQRDEAPEQQGRLHREREVSYRLPYSGAQRKIVEYRLALAAG